MIHNDKVIRIKVQPEKYKPTSLAPVELDVLRFKRAICAIVTVENSSTSKFSGILEFRGRTFTISRNSGDCPAEVVFRALAENHIIRYGDDGISPVEMSEEVWQCTAMDPETFVGFLHVISQGPGISLDMSPV